MLDVIYLGISVYEKFKKEIECGVRKNLNPLFWFLNLYSSIYKSFQLKHVWRTAKEVF